MKQIKNTPAIFFFLIVFVPINVIASHFAEERKSDQEVQPIPKTSIKCGECPCGNPCSQLLPPPPPPPPSLPLLLPPPPPPSPPLPPPPPPPLPPPPSPPPPKTTTSYCPPPPPRFYYFSSPDDDQAHAATPPPPRFTYITSGSPPGILYLTTDPFNLEIYNGVSFRSAPFFGFILLVLCSLLQVMIFYGAH